MYCPSIRKKNHFDYGTIQPQSAGPEIDGPVGHRTILVCFENTEKILVMNCVLNKEAYGCARIPTFLE
jgi:hypothetical protein